MTLSESAATLLAAIVGAFISGGIAFLIARYQRRQKQSPGWQKRQDAAWKQQVRELNDRINGQNEARFAQYEKTIAYLEAQIENRDREARHD